MTIPPTTPPAIASTSELLCEVKVEDEPGTDALGGKVDREKVLVDIAIKEAVPVTSGESPMASASVRFQLSPIDESKYAHLGTRVPSGTGSGKVPGVALVEQLDVHKE